MFMATDRLDRIQVEQCSNNNMTFSLNDILPIWMRKRPHVRLIIHNTA